MAQGLSLFCSWISKILATLASLTCITGGYALYALYTGAVDIDLINKLLIHRAELAIPGAKVTIGQGGSAAFLPHERALRASFKNITITREQDGFSAAIPALTLELRLPPWLSGAKADAAKHADGWFAAEAHDMHLLMPDLPPLPADPDGKRPSPETWLTAETWARLAERIPRVRALCAFHATAAFVSAPNDAIRLGKLCLHRRRTLSGADVAELEASDIMGRSGASPAPTSPADGKGPSVKLSLSLYPNGSAAVKSEFYNVGSALFRTLPGAGALAPALSTQEWRATGALAFASMPGLGAQEVRLKLEHADLPLPRFPSAPPNSPPERIILRNAEGYCLQSCTKWAVEAPDVEWPGAKLKGSVSADLRLKSGREETPFAALRPQDLVGEVKAGLSKIPLQTLLTLAEHAEIPQERLKSIKTYLKSGALQGVKLKAMLPGVLTPETRADALEAEAKFTDVAADLPQKDLKLRGLNGTMRWRKGTAELRSEGFRAGTVTLSDLSVKAAPRAGEAKIEAGFEGEFQDLKNYIPPDVSANSKKLSFIFGHTQAHAKGDISLRVPLPASSGGEAKPGQSLASKGEAPKPVLNLTAKLTEAALPGVSPALDASQGVLWLDIRPGTTTVNGRFMVTRRTAPPADPTETLLPVGESVATAEGPVEMDLKLGTGKPDKSTDLHLQLDLAQAQVRALADIYQKPPNVGTADYLLEGVSSAAGLRVASMRYSHGKEGFSVDEGAFTPESWRLRIKRAAFGPHDLTADVAGTSGAVQLTLGGAYLDAEALLAKAPKPADTPQQGPVWHVQLKPQVAKIRSALILHKVEGTLICRNAFCGEVMVVGTPEGSGLLTFSAEPLAGGPPRTRRFRLRAENPGGLAGPRLRSHISGGTLEATGLMKPLDGNGVSWSGTFVVRDFHITEMPLLGSLMTLATPQGFADLFHQRGMSIRSLSSPFRYEHDVLFIEDAVTKGAALGLTGKGKIDLNQKSIDLEGLVVPSPGGVNRVVGAIPVLGNLLTGGEDEGMIAMSYEVHGPFAKAQVRVNPFTAITPGILRKVFSGDLFEE